MIRSLLPTLLLTTFLLIISGCGEHDTEQPTGTSPFGNRNRAFSHALRSTIVSSTQRMTVTFPRQHGSPSSLCSHRAIQKCSSWRPSKRCQTSTWQYSKSSSNTLMFDSFGTTKNCQRSFPAFPAHAQRGA